MLLHPLRSGEARGSWIERDEKCIAMARTAAENSFSAMVIGVGTHPSYRRQGLATGWMA
ncbi:GNAT family N-acetyltransferase [Lihuaxuella thermophila]|uniref:GNAT family N-acetyltransferase n=1 Tax=Lihuaxuella thermophila TaxID=1173111 RepID=UPI001FCD1F28|nr:GNAT family N-acetyltransferase [Lihuaxuella thermophila]